MVRAFLPLFALLLFVAVEVVRANSEDMLVRKRREWIIPPKILKENTDYTDEAFVAKIRSDHEAEGINIEYSLKGIGANQHPFHVFVVDPKTGFIRVTKILDREEIASYNLSGYAQYRDGREAEKKIDIRIRVSDENDNSPEFGIIKPAEVYELSPAGTSVIQITATDADEPNHENSQVVYSIIAQNPPHDMFSITSDGIISVKKRTLDREKEDQYILTVVGKDLNGQPGGNTGTGTVTINILDVNDNLPTLEKEQYEASIEENTEGIEVMRIQAEDLDLKNTDNWEAVFDIVKGNEAGYFSITTDPKTNEGILMLNKAVNYEDVKNLDLGLVVRNKAPPHDESGASGVSGASGASPPWHNTYKTYPLKINVKNQPEGPRFDPKVKVISISEGGSSINIKDVIARYPAIDGDTGKPAENVKYAKGFDPDNWLTIDPETAEIKLNKMPDRESAVLNNGTYFAKILCISEDMPAKTATGTIAIQVEDFNDHCPTLTSSIQSMCTSDDSVIVNAKDEDLYPNGPPFDFLINQEGTKGKWQLEHLNDTAAILRAQESMWPGVYEVELKIMDEQGHACPEPQKVSVQVCTCEDGVVCGRGDANGKISKGAEFGPAGIGLLLLGLLLLLLIPLFLLFCHCGGAGGLPGGFTEMPFDTKSHLINYHTEGQGENTEVPLLCMPTQLDTNVVNLGMGMLNQTSAMVPIGGFDVQQSVTSIDGMNGAYYKDSSREQTWGMVNQSCASGFYSEFEGKESAVGGGIFDDMALPDHFLGQYYAQRVTSENETFVRKDSLLVYDYEGKDSPAGSVGCCSLLESDNDLQFLDDLGPKFKTLAEVCAGKMISTEIEQVTSPLPIPSINTQSTVSSVVTSQQLPPPPKLQPMVPKTGQTVVKESTQNFQMVKENMTTVKQGMTKVKKNMSNQGQMLLLQQQQPVLYTTTTPVVQPMHYIVQPQVQNTVLLAETPPTNLQGMVLVNGTQTLPAQGMVVQGQTVISSGQVQIPGMMLVERSGVQGAGSNLIQTDNLSGSQTMMVVEGQVPSGSIKLLKGNSTSLSQGGTLKSGGLSGSQSVEVVGKSVTSERQLIQEEGGLSQKSDVYGSKRVLYNTSNISHSSESNIMHSSTTLSTTPTYSKVVVHETREIH